MPNQPDRRQILVTTAAAITVVAIVNDPTAARAATKAKSMTYDVKPMPFDPIAIKGMSEKLLTSHYDNNYTGAVKRLNAIAAQLKTLDWPAAPNFTVNGLKREELVAMNSMNLHELYFAGLGAGGEPTGALAQAIERDFGSIADWRAQFAAMGKAMGGGSGWVTLNYMPRDKRLVNSWSADHTNAPANARPLLALDMYEHAYHMDYGAKAGAYVDAYMAAIDWRNATALYAKATA
jgi:Fe-Mn family superoxide dismutase